MKTIFVILFGSGMITLYGCSTSKKIRTSAKQTILRESALANAHIGISIYDPSKKRYLYQHQDTKYFVPGSNVKIATAYAAMKYIGNRIKGIRYEEHDNTIVIEGTGDPTFLHPDFKQQPVLEFLKGKRHILINTENWKDNSWGSGWAWDDYNEAYMTERSAIPMYENVVRISALGGESGNRNLGIYPSYFRDSLLYDEQAEPGFVNVKRNAARNFFVTGPSSTAFTRAYIPFKTYGFETSRKLLRDTLKTDVRASYYELKNPSIIASYHLDSVLMPMMHHSDNFLAEQTLLMASNEFLSVMNIEQFIDTILSTDFKYLPQKPRWADGSGLSRYNLFTPQDFVYILNKLNDEYGIDRMKRIFATGNEGTLKGYYVADSNFIFAKTGTMSGVVALSGYLITKKNKLLCFSILANNHTTSAIALKKAIEQFLLGVRRKN
jgi:D-alanyl-D-alanine carboxypeptidase/D-alanyl-D-alanine-endopeptidase (penicillin-binding protein 4)